MSRLNSAPAPDNAANVLQGEVRARSAPEFGEIVSTGTASAARMPQFVDAPHALAVMMDMMHALQARMVSMAGAIGNAADVSGARGIITDFAREAGRMRERLAGMTAEQAQVEQVAPEVADNIMPTVTPPVEVPPAIPAIAVAAPAIPPVAAAVGVTDAPTATVATAATPAPGITVVPEAVHVLSPALGNAGTSTPAAHMVTATPPGTPISSGMQTPVHSTPAPLTTLSNMTLPALPAFTLHTDPVPWLTGLRARLNLYNCTDAMRVNFAVTLLTPEVQNVYAHAFPGMACTFEDFCEWLQANFGKHTADDDIIRKLQTLRQHGRIAAYCAEFLALWNKLQSKPAESQQIKWFRQGLQHRVHDATLYDEGNVDWTDFSRMQAAVLRADARIHSHTSHYRETESARSDRRTTPGSAPRSSGSFQRRGFRGGRRGGPGGNPSSHGSAPHPANGSQDHGTKRPRAEGNVVQCFKCHDFGHKANVCPKPRRGGQSGAPSGQRSHGSGFPHRGGQAGPSSAPRQGNASTR